MLAFRGSNNVGITYRERWIGVDMLAFRGFNNTFERTATRCRNLFASRRVSTCLHSGGPTTSAEPTELYAAASATGAGTPRGAAAFFVFLALFAAGFTGCIVFFAGFFDGLRMP
jgi:hypothetical protein